MSILSKIFSGGTTKLVEGIGGILDELITSKDFQQMECRHD